MTELLDRVIGAHGDAARWRQFTGIQVACSVGGSSWPRDGVLAHSTATLDTRVQRVSFEPFATQGQRSRFTPDRVEILDANGGVVEERDDPRPSFEGHTADTWDGLHKVYFASYSLWNYLSLPFLMLWDGFRVEEIEPWQENDETWRRLRVRYPDYLVTHHSVQTFYFGADDNLLRRHDYDVDELRGLPAAHYCADYKAFDGFNFPTRRWVVPRKPDNTSSDGPVLVSVGLQSISLS